MYKRQIWTIRLEAEASVSLPPATSPDAVRALYFFDGPSLTVAGERFDGHEVIVVRSDRAIELRAGGGPVDVLLLQGKPIGEPVVQHGPFVMNSRAEIQQAMLDYQRTRFGGWPWESHHPVHGREKVRFAKHADGRVERIEP